MFWLLKYFDNFKNFTSHSMSMLSSTRKLGSKGSTLSKSNLDMMENSSHRDEYPAMQSNGPLPQVIWAGTFIIFHLPFLARINRYTSLSCNKSRLNFWSIICNLSICLCFFLICLFLFNDLPRCICNN